MAARVLKPQPPGQGAPGGGGRATQHAKAADVLRRIDDEEGETRGCVAGDEAEGRSVWLTAMAKDRHRLAAEKARRRAVEDREMRDREELEEREDRIWFFHCHRFESHGALMDFCEYEAAARGDLGDEETTAWALILHSCSTGVMVLRARDVWDAEVRVLADTEAQLRVDIEHSDTQLRFELAKTARQCWLQARRAELDADPAETTAEDAELAEAFLEELRTLRRQQLEAEQQREREDAVAEQKYTEEKIEMLWNLLTSELEELQRYESFVRHQTALDEAAAFDDLGAWEEQGLFAATEAFHRTALELTRVASVGDALVRSTQAYAAVLHVQRQRDMRAYAQEERTGWLKARVAYLKRLDDRVRDRDEQHTRKMLREQEERNRTNERILTYTRAEGDDRAYMMAEERSQWRGILAAANVSMKEVTMLLVTREVEREMEDAKLYWTQELWDELEGGDMEGRKVLERDEQKAWDAIEDEENRAFLRSRGMMLRRERAERKKAERQAALEAVKPPEKPEVLYVGVDPTEAHSTEPTAEMQRLMGRLETERERSLTNLKVKWEGEEERARDARLQAAADRERVLAHRLQAHQRTTQQAIFDDELLLLAGEEMAGRRAVETAHRDGIVAYVTRVTLDHPCPLFFYPAGGEGSRAATPARSPSPGAGDGRRGSTPRTPRGDAGTPAPTPTPQRAVPASTPSTTRTKLDVDDDVALDPAVVATKLRLLHDTEESKRSIVTAQEARARTMLRNLHAHELLSIPLVGPAGGA